MLKIGNFTPVSCMHSIKCLIESGIVLKRPNKLLTLHWTKEKRREIEKKKILCFALKTTTNLSLIFSMVVVDRIMNLMTLTIGIE
jgi:hypothetical protein